MNHMVKVVIYNSLFHMDDLVFSWKLISFDFISAENSYLVRQINTYTMLNKTPLLHQSSGPRVLFSLSLSPSLFQADILWFTQKANKAPARGLLCSRRPQVPSWWGEGAEHLLERVLEAWAGKWTQRASVLEGISMKERERDSKTRGPKLWWSKGVLINMV